MPLKNNNKQSSVFNKDLNREIENIKKINPSYHNIQGLRKKSHQY